MLEYTKDTVQMDGPMNSIERIVYLVENGLTEEIRPLYSGRSCLGCYVKGALKRFVNGKVPGPKTIENLRGFEKSMSVITNIRIESVPSRKGIQI